MKLFKKKKEEKLQYQNIKILGFQEGQEGNEQSFHETFPRGKYIHQVITFPKGRELKEIHMWLE